MLAIVMLVVVHIYQNSGYALVAITSLTIWNAPNTAPN